MIENWRRYDCLKFVAEGLCRLRLMIEQLEAESAYDVVKLGPASGRCRVAEFVVVWLVTSADVGVSAR